MENPGGDPPKRPRKTLAERREAAKIAARITRQRMEAEELARDEEEGRMKQAEMDQEKKEQELSRKQAQEQLDYEMALRMSEAPTESLLQPQEEETPKENPLLLPCIQHEGQIQNPSLSSSGHGSTRHPISHNLNCEGCGGNFNGTKVLKLHVRENPDCLHFWGGDLKSLEKNVKAEFKRRTARRNYKENTKAQLARKKAEYWANRQKHLDRKKNFFVANKEKVIARSRSYYDTNSDKEKARYKVYYEANKEKEKLRQAAVRASRVETQTTLTDLATFKKEGRYGPIFPCVCCWQLNWYFSMSILEDLNTISHNFVDIQHVRENTSLFEKQNRFFICRPCKSDLEKGRCPKMSVRNHLEHPWKNVPSPLLTITPVRINFFDAHYSHISLF